MRVYQEHPNASPAEKELAEILEDVLDINKENPETIEYLTNRAKKALT